MTSSRHRALWTFTWDDITLDMFVTIFPRYQYLFPPCQQPRGVACVAVTPTYSLHTTYTRSLALIPTFRPRLYFNLKPAHRAPRVPSRRFVRRTIVCRESGLCSMCAAYTRSTGMRRHRNYEVRALSNESAVKLHVECFGNCIKTPPIAPQCL